MKNSIRRNDDDGHDAQTIMKWSFRFKSFVIILKSYEIGFIDCLIGMRKKTDQQQLIKLWMESIHRIPIRNTHLMSRF